MIIGISGKLGTGKDYIVKNYIEPYFSNMGLKTLIVAFADHFKVNAAAQAGLPIETMYNNKTPEIRKMLQKTGTEDGRNVFGPDIWINTLEKWVQLRVIRDNVNVFIVTDCRFKNELEWVKSKGHVLRIFAPDRNSIKIEQESNGNNDIAKAISSHSSETELDDQKFEFVVDNTISNCSNVKAEVQAFLSSCVI